MARLYSRSAAVAEPVSYDAGVLDHEMDDDADIRHLPIATQRARQSVHGSGRISQDARVERDEVRVETNAIKYVNPTNLDAPSPRAGFVQRWIRDGSLDPKDQPHWFKKMREGWRPRAADSIPESQRAVYPSMKAVDGREVIRVAGLVLCEMPKDVAYARKAAVQDSINMQTSAVLPTNEAITSKTSNGKFGPVQVTENKENTFRGQRKI